MTIETLQPKEWPRPKGYANGIAARGRMIFVAGQIGWDPRGQFVSDVLSDQVKQALRNIVRVLAEANADPSHVVRLTWFVLDRDAYLREVPQIGAAYREIMGRNFPAMSVIEISRLVEERALVEIEATAMVPDETHGDVAAT